MQFNTYEFITILLPLTLIAYYSLGRICVAMRKLIICTSGIALYAYAGAKGLLIFVLSMAMNFILAELMLEKQWLRKPVLIISIVCNILFLFVFKYADFAIANFNVLSGKRIDLLYLTLPLGISFFTFQQIAYVVNVYNGKIKQVKLLDYATYILYFPKLIMGPIVDPCDLMSQINDPKIGRFNLENFASGVKLFSFGLFKKIILADTMATAVSWGNNNFSVASSLDWIIIMFCYTFEIYFDFSGYSDMAVGISSMMNIDLPINFDSPYKSISVRDFWDRWHMSLTNFLTHYVYIPLGGSRKGKIRTYINVFIVFVVSGIWHGANWTFILWGALYGILSVTDRIIEPVWKKVFKPIRWLITFAIVNILWLLFNAGSISEWIAILTNMIGGGDYSLSSGLADCFMLKEIGYCLTFLQNQGLVINISNTVWMGIVLGLLMLLCLIPKNNYINKTKMNCVNMILAAVAFSWSFLCLGAESVFIYNNF